MLVKGGREVKLSSGEVLLEAPSQESSFVCQMWWGVLSVDPEVADRSSGQAYPGGAI